jgi:hypothetical protein
MTRVGSQSHRKKILTSNQIPQLGVRLVMLLVLITDPDKEISVSLGIKWVHK